ncbi:MAP7 domain-containing protein 1-like [Drosophila ficusphila]|uniref:MAP7 domain-containing protein 1-like n=1 Tax=Drosophila ficusphila TaxID=30025 RepID=UPI001C89703B|nr:MAP7 domain-containing protein 1-like [Drosophila ficusphila]
MSTIVTRAEARRRMEAAKDPEGLGRGQGWSGVGSQPGTRPTRTSRQVLKDPTPPEPEPTVSSDSEVEMIDDPREEARRWRLGRAAGRSDNSIPVGIVEVPDGPSGPARANATTRADMALGLCRTLWNEGTPIPHQAGAGRRRWERHLEELRQVTARYKELKQKIADEEKDREARASWEARLEKAEQEERALWESPEMIREVPLPTPGMVVPPTPRHWVEEIEEGERTPESKPESPEWMPERPPTPGGLWDVEPSWDATPSPPRWVPARPPTPHPGKEEAAEDRPAAGRPPSPMEQQAPEEAPASVGPLRPEWRADIPEARVSHSLKEYVEEGVRWCQHTVEWRWPTGATPRMEESPEEAEAAPEEVEEEPEEEPEPWERGPWLWPEVAAVKSRPGFKRQASLPVARAGPPEWRRQVSVPDERRWLEVPRTQWPAEIEACGAVEAARRRGGRRCVMVQRGAEKFRVRVGPGGIRVYTQ